MYLFDKRKEQTVPYKAIKIGETFYDIEKEAHAMKIASCEDEEGCINAIDLETGGGLFYEDNEEVVPTKARVEIYA